MYVGCLDGGIPGGECFLYVAQGGVAILSHLSPWEPPCFWSHVRPGRHWVRVSFCPRCGRLWNSYGGGDLLCPCGVGQEERDG